MGLIFFLSDRPKDESMEMSGWFTIVFQWLGYTYEELEAMNVVLFIRKLAHFTIYFILSIWSMRLEWKYLVRHDSGKRFPGLAVAWCLLYAISDEFHQAFVPGRGPHILDVAIDLSGAVFAAMLGSMVKK